MIANDSLQIRMNLLQILRRKNVPDSYALCLLHRVQHDELCGSSTITTVPTTLLHIEGVPVI